MAKKTSARKSPAGGGKKPKKAMADQRPRASKGKEGATGAKASLTRPAPASKSRAPEKNHRTTALFPIVAVGASAGGLEAFTKLLKNLPADTGMSFVFLQHLSHASKSMLPEILGRATSMPVSAVNRDAQVEPNHLYVIPPNVDLSLSKETIEVTPRPKSRRVPMPIDRFMCSLAEQRKTRAIGVILSGTGFDGTQGLAAIKTEGGITFTQDLESAAYPDMPRNASVATGAVDFTLPPDRIAQELAEIARHPYLNHVARAPQTVELAEDLAEEPADKLNDVFALIRKETGVNFSDYRLATIRRRIARRMVVHKTETLDAYVKLLRKNADAVAALQQDLLIGVTSFFREREVFEILQKKIFPRILKNRSPDEPVRVWVPACATGEEAYSVAICLLEALGDRNTEVRVQIFATDISEQAIRKARRGLFPEGIGADVPAAKLQRFFVRKKNGYQITESVRDLCVFAVQNVVKDPPFSKMDLISCRNVLIYLGATSQERVLNALHYALKPCGLLLLGASETTLAASHLFQQEDEKGKIYSKRQVAEKLTIDFPGRVDLRKTSAKTGGPPRRDSDIEKEANTVVLKNYAPAGVVINDTMDVVLFRERTTPFLQPPSGKPTFNILKMVHKDLAVDLRAVIHQARESAAPATRERLELKLNGQARRVNLIAVPLTSRRNHCLVLFEETAEKPWPEPEQASPRKTGGRKKKQTGQNQELSALREELAETKRDLEAIIEEQESSNEELQSANEESLSSNEELQSTNEELQTAKEELQATNEELTTVNQELHNRNAELTQVNNDLNNLIAGLDVGVVMLGPDLRIRQFTPAAAKLLRLIPGDVGRPIGNINPELNLDNLEASAAEVIDTLAGKEQEAQDSRGRWYSVRIRPYKTMENKIEGAMVTLVDIHEMKLSQETAKAAGDFAENIAGTIREPLVVLDNALRVVSANRAFYETFQVMEEETEGNQIYELGNGQWDIPRLRELLEEIIPERKQLEDFEVRHEFPGIGRKIMLLNARQIVPNGGRERLILLAIEDVTGRRAKGAAWHRQES